MAIESVKPERPDELLDAGTTPTSFETGVRQKPELGILEKSSENDPQNLILHFGFEAKKIIKQPRIGKPDINKLFSNIDIEGEGAVKIPDDLTR